MNRVIQFRVITDNGWIPFRKGWPGGDPEGTCRNQRINRVRGVVVKRAYCFPLPLFCAVVFGIGVILVGCATWTT